MWKLDGRRSAFGFLAAVLMLMAVDASAQQPTRIRGEIEKADGAALQVKDRSGATVNVKLADDVRVSALVKASLADIKNDTFVGIAGMPRPDGSIEAFSIHIFLPAQRGVVPDRHGPWDARPGSTMTNAYVESKVEAKDGDSLIVKYKDGEKKIAVTPATAITAVAAGDKSELKPGASIIIMSGDKQPDGSVLAKTLYVGRGVAPAM
ncbi:hypothetical protein MXD81_04130 [Microbacteriaceae bacterium K1510]|nr:hypothetical protein [Microbacteriaceae bacterium K1510]